MFDALTQKKVDKTIDTAANVAENIAISTAGRIAGSIVLGPVLGGTAGFIGALTATVINKVTNSEPTDPALSYDELKKRYTQLKDIYNKETGKIPPV